MARELWFGQDGITLSQHTSGDDRFPGWQKNLGEGTHQADYTSGGKFPNDDASHIQVGDGWKATVMQNSYEAGNQGSGDKEEVFFGPTSENLTDYDMNDMVSEVIVERVAGDSDDNQDGNDSGSSSDTTSDPGPTAEEIAAIVSANMEQGNDLATQEPKKDNTLIYVIGGVVILGLGVMLMR